MTSKLWEIKATTIKKWVLDCWLGQQSACHASKKAWVWIPCGHVKIWAWQEAFVVTEVGSRDKGIPRAYWLSSLAPSVSSSLCEKLWPQKWSDWRRHLISMSSIHTHCHTCAHAPPCTRAHKWEYTMHTHIQKPIWEALDSHAFFFWGSWSGGSVLRTLAAFAAPVSGGSQPPNYNSRRFNVSFWPPWTTVFTCAYRQAGTYTYT